MAVDVSDLKVGRFHLNCWSRDILESFGKKN